MDRPKVLVIEGDRKYADLMAGSLEQAGFTVFTAADGGEGVALAGSLTPALILLNLATPGTDGLEICKAIHGRSPELPILLLTQKEAAFNPIYTANYGIVDFLKKPFSGNALVETVKGILNVGEPAAVEAETAEAAPVAEAAEMVGAEEALPVFEEEAEEEAIAEAEPAVAVEASAEAEDAFEARPIDLPEGDLFERPEPAPAEPDELVWMEEAGEMAPLNESEPASEQEPDAEEPSAVPMWTHEKEAEAPPASAEADASETHMDIHAPAGAEETAEAISAPEVEEAAPAKRQGIGKKIYIPALLVPLLAIVGFVAIYVFNLWGNREAEPLKPAEVVDEKVAPEPADTAAVEETTQTPAPAEPARGAPDKPKPELPGAKPTAAESDKLKAAPRPQAKPQPQAKAALEAGAGAKAPVSTHFVQFGYFGAEENASRLSLKLKGMGLKIRVAEEQGKAKTFYRVVLDEAFASEEAARQRAADIKSTHGVDAIALSRAD